MIKTGTMEERPQNRGSHKLSVMNRRTGSITGVSDVISFDISEVLLETELGMLQIKGADLHVNRLSLEKGEIDLEGRIDSFQYSEVSDFKKARIPVEPPVSMRVPEMGLIRELMFFGLAVPEGDAHPGDL